jgi:phage terminase large subunit
MRGSSAVAVAANSLADVFLGAAAAEAHRPVFRGANLEAQAATDPELVLAGPAGTGKSVALLNKLHTNAERYPGSRQLILRKTRASLTESALVTFEEKVLPVGHPALLGAGGQRLVRGNRESYDYPNRSTIVIGGMDKMERIFSAEYDTIYWQEATEGRLEEWESLLRALRNNKTPHRQLLGDCNPGPPGHWLRSRSKTGRLRMVDTFHRDNPFLWNGEDWTPAGREYVGNLERMTGVLRDRLYLGLWVAAEGAIYTMFKRSGQGANLVPRFTAPSGWRVVLSIDFGFTHPLAAGVWLIDGDGRMVLEHELHMAGRTLDEHVPALKGMLRGRPYEGVADSSSPESIERLRALGINCQPAVKGPDSVRAGIRQVVARMQQAGDGRPRLTVMEGALWERDEERAKRHLPLCLIDELELYRWKLDGSGQAQEEPVKEHDDACDQMRYAVAYVDRVDSAGDAETSAVSRSSSRRWAF